MPFTHHYGEKYPLRFLDEPPESLRMETTVEIGNIVRIALHDTGAGISAMNPDILKVLNVLPFTEFRRASLLELEFRSKITRFTI